MQQKPPLDPRSKLPVAHPDYLYPPSRNIYSQKLAHLSAEARCAVDAQTETRRGHWREAMPDRLQSKGPLDSNRPLHVEVGCNAGHVVLEWAAARPQEAFIGLDLKLKPIFWGVEKAVKRKIDNVLFLRAHATRLAHIFGEGEIDTLSIFFPDPWPPKSQWKNRWVTAARLRAVAPLLKKGGLIDIKTDHPGYFEWIEEAASQCTDLFDTELHTRDLHAGLSRADALKLEIPAVTLFEKLFIRDGIPIQRLKLRTK